MPRWIGRGLEEVLYAAKVGYPASPGNNGVRVLERHSAKKADGQHDSQSDGSSRNGVAAGHPATMFFKLRFYRSEQSQRGGRDPGGTEGEESGLRHGSGRRV